MINSRAKKKEGKKRNTGVCFFFLFTSQKSRVVRLAGVHRAGSRPDRDYRVRRRGIGGRPGIVGVALFLFSSFDGALAAGEENEKKRDAAHDPTNRRMARGSTSMAASGKTTMPKEERHPFGVGGKPSFPFP